MPPGEAAALIADLARAVAAAHRAGIIHRDLKPSNILFDVDGTAKVADFGLAKRFENEDGQTLSGQVMGTPSYMSPEQAGGKNREVGPAADIYALGAILYEILACRPPFKGTSPTETILMVLTEDPTPPSRLQRRLPRDLETICLKCLSKEPRRRYATADELAEDLGRYLASQPILARPIHPAERAVKWARRHRITAVLSAAGLVTAMILGAVAIRSEIATRWEAAHFRLNARNTISHSDDLRANGQLDNARDLLVRLLAQLSGRPRLSEWHDVAAYKLDQIDRLREERKAVENAHERLATFGRLRDEALILDAQIAGSGSGVGRSSLVRTREAARAALGVFATETSGLGLEREPRPETLSPEQWAEVESDSYLVGMVLSEAIARPLPGEDSRSQFDEALALLEQRGERPRRDAGLSRPSRRATRTSRRQGGRSPRARAGRDAPALRMPTITSCSARTSLRLGDWPAARVSFESAPPRTAQLAPGSLSAGLRRAEQPAIPCRRSSWRADLLPPPARVQPLALLAPRRRQRPGWAGADAIVRKTGQVPRRDPIRGG